MSSSQSEMASKAGLPDTDQALLRQLSYGISSHPPESTDWLNVFLAQVLTGYRIMVLTLSEQDEGGLKGLAEQMLNPMKDLHAKPGVVELDYINVTEADLGVGFPSFSGARIVPSETVKDKVRIELDFTYEDRMSLGVETKVLINFPKPRFAILPVSLGLTLVKFSGTLMLDLANSTSGVPPFLSVSLEPDFDLQLEARSLIGSRAKLQDVPKIQQLIVDRLRAYLISRIVWPKKRIIPFPRHKFGKTKDADSPIDGRSTPISEGERRYSMFSDEEGIDLSAKARSHEADDVLRAALNNEQFKSNTRAAAFASRNQSRFPPAERPSFSRTHSSTASLSSYTPPTPFEHLRQRRQQA